MSAMLPFIIVAIGIVVNLLVVPFLKRKSAVSYAIALAALVFACFSLIVAQRPYLTGAADSAATLAIVAQFLAIDGLSFLGVGIVLLSGLVVLIFARPYVSKQQSDFGVFYSLILLATLGAMVLCASTHFASIFLGLETLSVSLYALIAYHRNRLDANKSALSYLILASVAAAFIFLGMAIIYYLTGKMDIASIATGDSVQNPRSVLYYVGLCMVAGGFAFKLAIVPFHMWAPDVYENAPAPVAGIIASMSKAAVMLPLIRVVIPGTQSSSAAFIWAIGGLSALSMLVGNIMALREMKVKRMLAFSSISQLGYLLVPLLAGGAYGAAVAVFYLFAYSVANILAFAVVSELSLEHRDSSWRNAFQGLAWSNPVLASILTISMLSLAGMPLTAGFIGKYLLFTSGLRAQSGLASTISVVLVILLAINSAISIFYYLRLVSVMFRKIENSASDADRRNQQISPLSISVGSVLSILLIIIGVFPGGLLEWIQSLSGM